MKIEIKNNKKEVKKMPKAAEDLVKKIESGLMEKYPKKKPSEIESIAYAIVQKIWKKKTGHPAFN